MSIDNPSAELEPAINPKQILSAQQLSDLNQKSDLKGWLHLVGHLAGLWNGWRDVFRFTTVLSIGAQQAYHWGALYPDRVARIAALCGTARTTDHNKIFLMSLRSALISDPAWTGDRFEGIPERGFRTFAQIYASWATSQAFYRARLYLDWGYTMEDYLLQGWEANYRKRDPHDLIAMLDTWLHCDVGQNPIYQGDSAAALKSIQAQTRVMPSTTDLYFTPEDCQAETLLHK
jgi:homoserine O-acetyltransferase/O-succinyltransferase